VIERTNCSRSAAVRNATERYRKVTNAIA
jgi:hypothetical protein